MPALAVSVACFAVPWRNRCDFLRRSMVWIWCAACVRGCAGCAVRWMCCVWVAICVRVSYLLELSVMAERRRESEREIWIWNRESGCCRRLSLRIALV